MTSEVLMLNKDAVVIAADSAVTTGREPHPRYSKSANKIFDLTAHGSVALTIYSSADVDRVPWELALKLFRQKDAGSPERAHLDDYLSALITYMQANNQLFPVATRESLLTKRLYNAAVHALNVIALTHPAFVGEAEPPALRAAAWTDGSAALSAAILALPIQAPLAEADLERVHAAAVLLHNGLTAELAADEKYKYVDAPTLGSLAAEILVRRPFDFLPSTGVVIAGYGRDQIFPSYAHVHVYGHVGDTLLWEKRNGYAITHDNDAWIQPFAQSSMISRFTDGFDATLSGINSDCSLEMVNGVLKDLAAAGVAIDPLISTPIVGTRHAAFMQAFRDKNWNENFYPLRRVLNSLSVPEMGHLAESLLVLEALRERVTSPSESIGGPIDVAVITKGEGLIWLKRKHYFQPELNLRYVNRLKTD